MKILMIINALGGGGAERFVVDLANQIARNSCNEIYVLVTDDSHRPGALQYSKELKPEIKLICTDCTPHRICETYPTVLRVIRQVRPDIVHFHYKVMWGILPYLFVRGPRYCHTLHNLAYRCINSKSRLQRFLTYMLYSHEWVKAITISKECHKSYVNLYGLNNDICIDNGREPIHTTEKLNVVRRELEAIGVFDDSPIFIHVAGHRPAKNHDRLFKTFRRLAVEGIPFQLIVLGTGYDKYEKSMQDIPQIHLLGSRDNVADYMSFAHYFVLTSDAEGLPLSLLEAMSMGVIPVCTPAGGIKDVLRNGENGFMSPLIDDESFYLTVREALKKKNTISREVIVREFYEKYSMEFCANKYYSVYESLLAK